MKNAFLPKRKLYLKLKYEIPAYSDIASTQTDLHMPYPKSRNFRTCFTKQSETEKSWKALSVLQDQGPKQQKLYSKLIPQYWRS